MSLIDRLFSESQATAIKDLWEDKNSRLLIERQIGASLVDSNEFIEVLPLTQLMLITSLATFSTSEEESVKIAEIINWGINKKDILPYVSDYINPNVELAYKCLIGLGIFKKALETRSNRRGAPSPTFYRNVGISTFNNYGFTEISSHFFKWELFMNEMLI